MNEKLNALTALDDTIRLRRENPQEGSYTCYLFEKGIDKILKKCYVRPPLREGPAKRVGERRTALFLLKRYRIHSVLSRRKLYKFDKRMCFSSVVTVGKIKITGFVK